MALALVLVAVLLLVVPALLTGSTLLEGALRLAIFLAGVAALSRLPSLRRAFGYHGAEHKAVACLEAGLPLTPDNARGFSRLHPRCGTGFLLVMVVVAGVVYLPFAPSPWYLLVASRLLLFPLIVGLSFELVRMRALAGPGLQLQRLTTREPDAGQLAVAIAAVEAVLPAEDRVTLKAVA